MTTNNDHTQEPFVLLFNGLEAALREAGVEHSTQQLVQASTALYATLEVVQPLRTVEEHQEVVAAQPGPHRYEGVPTKRAWSERHTRLSYALGRLCMRRSPAAKRVHAEDMVRLATRVGGYTPDEVRDAALKWHRMVPCNDSTGGWTPLEADQVLCYWYNETPKADTTTLARLSGFSRTRCEAFLRDMDERTCP